MPVSHIKPKSFFLDVSGSFLRIWSHFPEGEGCRILSYWLLLKVAVVISKALQVTWSWWHLLKFCKWFINDYPASAGTPKMSFVLFFLYFQPGCVNTTEVDIKKSSRMRNPHKTRKVNERVSYGLIWRVCFQYIHLKNPSSDVTNTLYPGALSW